jgi:hypothetical protein
MPVTATGGITCPGAADEKCAQNLLCDNGELGESRRWLGMARATTCLRIREYGIVASAGSDEAPVRGGLLYVA